MKNCKDGIVRIVLAVLLAAGILGIQPAKAETIDFGWVQGGGGGANLDYGTAIAVDGSGNAYFTGFVNNGPGNEDGFLNKWDANGNQAWSNFVAGTGHDANHAVALDGEGNVYVSGAFSDTVEFDPGNSAGDLTSLGSTDAFVVKYDPAGDFVWVKGVGGTSEEGAYGMTVDGSGNLYLTGIYAGTVDFDPGVGVSSLTSGGSGDVFVLKLDGNGNFVWAKSMGGSGRNNSFDIAVDASGNVITTGYFNGTADFDPGAGTSNLTSNGQGDIFVSKLDNSGDFLWARQMGGTEFDSGIEVTVDGKGNAYLAGYRNFDILISKLDPDGNFLWANVMGGLGADAAYGIALDQNANVYITGDFGGTVDFDPGAGTSNLTSAGGNDIFISKLDTDGNFLWAKHMGGTSMDLGEGIFVRNDGSLYLAGVFSDTVDFDLGEGTSTLTSGGNLDVFLSKQHLTSQIHYVKWNATGANDGTSWANAFTDLQSALAAASSGDEIWVAAGTYKPTSGTDRTISFNLKNGVAAYGGFAGTEMSRTERNYDTNLTILSGDIGAPDNNSDNSYHVLVGSNTGNSTVLDGFTIAGGNANNPSSGVAHMGGGMYNTNGSPALTNLIFLNNSAVWGGGIANEDQSNPVLVNVTFSGNTTQSETAYPPSGGGMFNTNSSPSLTNVTFHNNSAEYGGGLFNNISSSPSLVNITISGNIAIVGGGMVTRDANSHPALTNVTLHGNSATDGGGIADAGGIIIRNSIVWGNTGGSIDIVGPGTPAVSYSIVQGGYAGTGNVDSDPLLGPLQENGGFTQTMALGAGSPAIDAADDANCPTTDQRGVTRPQGSHCDLGAYEYDGLDTVVDVFLGISKVGSYLLAPQASLRESYAGVNNGPVRIVNTHGVPIMAAERVIYKVNGINTSFSEMMGLPASQLDTTYWLPWYNNVDLDTQLRFANVSALPATVSVYIGGDEMTGSPFTLAVGESTRKSFPAINAGPVKIQSDVNIVAAERVIYKVNAVNTSFSELMALPDRHLDTAYWLPWYNNKDLDTQLRFANVSSQPASVRVYIAGAEMTGSPYMLAAGASIRKSFPAINNGPVKIVSDQDIVAAERVIYKVNGKNTSFSEMMALPDSHLNTVFWLPWYNNRDLDTQLRFANTTNSTATVHVFIGDTEMTGSPFTLLAGESTRRSFLNINNGPVKIVSDVPIVAAERVIYKVNGVKTSFSEMMGLPNALLGATFWFPWYNNIDLDTQLRFGLP